jgi:hypothetical protein
LNKGIYGDIEITILKLFLKIMQFLQKVIQLMEWLKERLFERWFSTLRKRHLRFFVEGPSENYLGQCIRNGVPWIPGVPRSESKGSGRKIYYNIKMIKTQRQTNCSAKFQNSTLRYQVKYKKNLRRRTTLR